MGDFDSALTDHRAHYLPSAGPFLVRWGRYIGANARSIPRTFRARIRRSPSRLRKAALWFRFAVMMVFLYVLPALCVLAAVGAFVPNPWTTYCRTGLVLAVLMSAVLVEIRPTMLWRSQGGETAALHVNRSKSGRRAVHGYTRWLVRAEARTTVTASLACDVLEMAIATDTVLVTRYEIIELGAKYTSDYGFRPATPTEKKRYKVGGASGLIFNPDTVEPGFIDRLRQKIADRERPSLNRT